jgi:hypothetical protein
MSDPKKDLKLQGIRPVLDELDKINPDISAQISREIEEIQNQGYLSSEGALSDVVAPVSKVNQDVRREVQTFSATQDEGAKISLGRRQFFKVVASIGISYTSSVAARISVDYFSSDDTFDESFLMEVLRLDSDKLDLLDLRTKLLNSGRSDEARLLTLIFPGGESFNDTYETISELERITRESKLSMFSKVYLSRVLSHHYGYLGLHLSAKSRFSNYFDYETSNSRLNVHILSAKFMNRYKELYSQRNLAAELVEDSNQLAESYRKHFDADISALDIGAILESRSISTECAALKGMYLQNLCMAAASEREALSILELIDLYRLNMFQTIPLGVNEHRVIRSYGECVWWYGRVAIIAFLNTWDKVVEKCLVSFYESAMTANSTEAELFNAFHQSHKNSLRSPVWLQMALLFTMWSEVKHGNGQAILNMLIPAEKAYQFRHNIEITRSYNALSVALGRSPIDIPLSQALAADETEVLRDCIKMMIRRRDSF